ncbi:MAG: hypothetical protein RLO12_08670, partial [Fulvivirga sp.]
MKSHNIFHVFRLALLFFAIVVFFIFIALDSKTNEKIKKPFVNKAMCTYQMNSHFSGILEAFYIDTSNKGAFTLKLKNNTTENEYPMYYMGRVQEYLSIGDSIDKPKGKLEIYIYKKGFKDSLIHYQSPYNCNKTSGLSQIRRSNKFK